jgi:clan AA aspartic protease
MNGFVDRELRALIDVSVSADRHGDRQSLRVWIDTAFNGGLVIPRPQIALLGLSRASCIEALLADGQLVQLETFSCVIHWFGKVFRTQVVANDGEFPLLGTLLLAGRKLSINYETATLSLT